MATSNAPPMRQCGVLPGLGWACYLGSSWTWVIGMFFPVLLLRDYGLGGWVVFAVPNVVGAAAMGWGLTPAMSRRIVQRHRSAMAVFSGVTCIFNFAVVQVICTVSLGALAGFVLLIAFLALILLMCWRAQSELWIAVMVTGVSLALFCAWGFPGHSWVNMTWSFQHTRLSAGDLLLFLPASVTGFMLCPYLDMTFHRARQHTEPWTGRFAFTIGFGFFFLCMILFSLSYAGVLGQGYLPFRDMLAFLPLAPLLLLTLHVVMQAAFTVSVHITAYEPVLRGARTERYRQAIVGILIGELCGFALVVAYLVPIPGLGHFEIIYRCFLLFYGVVFPGYVWLCMIPTWAQWSARRRMKRGATRQPHDAGRDEDGAGFAPSPRSDPWRSGGGALIRRRVVWAAAVAAALPMSFVGFVEGRSLWIIAGLGTLAAARGVVELLEIRRERSSTAD